MAKFVAFYYCAYRKDFERLGWDSIGGQDDTKLALQQALEWPIKYPQTFTRLGVKPPRGILLYGPPGCSKSTIVRAAAHSSGATFLTLSAAKVFSPFFGDAEAAVRQVFRDARAALPAIVFFDEIDVLVAKRQFDGSSDASSGSSSVMRVMSTMLNEMDGVESADGTFCYIPYSVAEIDPTIFPYQKPISNDNFRKWSDCYYDNDVRTLGDRRDEPTRLHRCGAAASRPL